jgi:hypothetical protein
VGIGIVVLLLAIGYLASFPPATSASPSSSTQTVIEGYSPNVQLLNQTLTLSQGHSARIIFSIVPQHHENLYVYVNQQSSGIPTPIVIESFRNGTLPAGVSVSMPMGNGISVSNTKVIIPVIISASGASAGVVKLQVIFYQEESTLSGQVGGSGTVVPLNLEVTS